MGRRTVGGFILILTILTTSAFGYEDTGFDSDDTQNCAVPDDPEVCAKSSIGNPDIRSTTRKVRQNVEGRRFLSITIRSFQPVMDGDAWVGFARLDARGDGHPDFVMGFLNSPEAFLCGVRGGGRGFRRGRFDVTPDRATCVVPLRYVRPSKKIRWRVKTDYYFPEPYPTWDYAPGPLRWYV